MRVGLRLVLTFFVAILLRAGEPGCLVAAEPRVGSALPAWQPGMLDIHQINTGQGDSALFIFPDATTLLLDAGAVQGRPRAASYDSPPRPNHSRRAGEWIVH